MMHDQDEIQTDDSESLYEDSKQGPNQTKVGLTSQPFLKKLAMKLAKLVIISFVLYSVFRQTRSSWDKLPNFQYDPTALLVSGILYVLGLFIFGLYYSRVVRLVTPGICTRTCIKSYILSHPAKYVPGKAMVVVMRVGMLSRAGSRPTAAMLATLYETLSMMAIGGFLGGFFLLMPPSHFLASAISFGLGLAFLTTVLPSTFSKAARLLKKGLKTIQPGDAPQPDSRVRVQLLLLGILGWLCWGLSQVAVVYSLDNQKVFHFFQWPRILGATMLATAGGFAIPILPGGFGLREWILNEVTGSVLGMDLSIAAALLLRFVWIIGEIVAAGLVSLIPSVKVPTVPANIHEAL